MFVLSNWILFLYLSAACSCLLACSFATAASNIIYCLWSSVTCPKIYMMIVGDGSCALCQMEVPHLEICWAHKLSSINNIKYHLYTFTFLSCYTVLLLTSWCVCVCYILSNIKWCQHQFCYLIGLVGLVCFLWVINVLLQCFSGHNNTRSMCLLACHILSCVIFHLVNGHYWNHWKYDIFNGLANELGLFKGVTEYNN